MADLSHPPVEFADVDGQAPVWQMNLANIAPVAYPTAGGPPAPFATTESTDLMVFTLSSRPPTGRPPQHHNADFDEILFYFEGPGPFGKVTEPGAMTWIPKGVTHWGANENVPEGYLAWLIESRGRCASPMPGSLLRNRSRPVNSAFSPAPETNHERLMCPPLTGLGL